VTPPDPSTPSRQAVLERLYHEHHATVLRYLMRRTDEQQAQDLVAEVFLVAWRRLDHVPTPAAGWLCGVARNLLANAERARRRREALTVRLGGLASAQPLNPEEHATRSDTAVLSALRRLSPADQEVLMLTAWDGLSGSEAARALGCPRAVYNVRLHRARRRLAQTLAQMEDRAPARDPGLPTTQPVMENKGVAS
jgi:RNA polymerase sigma-70 factor, ECF subfamily